MELRHLRSFMAVAAEQNFTRAADRLGIAQPPLSRHIKELEQDLGVALFDRGSRPVRLTEAGRILHQQAAQILASIDQIPKTMQQYASAQQPRSPSHEDRIRRNVACVNCRNSKVRCLALRGLP